MRQLVRQDRQPDTARNDDVVTQGYGTASPDADELPDSGACLIDAHPIQIHLRAEGVEKLPLRLDQRPAGPASFRGEVSLDLGWRFQSIPKNEGRRNVVAWTRRLTLSTPVISLLTN